MFCPLFKGRSGNETTHFPNTACLHPPNIFPLLCDGVVLCFGCIIDVEKVTMLIPSHTLIQDGLCNGALGWVSWGCGLIQHIMQPYLSLVILIQWDHSNPSDKD